MNILDRVRNKITDLVATQIFDIMDAVRELDNARAHVGAPETAKEPDHSEMSCTGGQHERRGSYSTSSIPESIGFTSARKDPE